MNNKDNYKSAINQIHASEELKSKTLEKLEKSKSNYYSVLKFLSTCAAVFVVCLIGINSVYYEDDLKISKHDDIEKEIGFEEDVLLANAELPRFESMEELKEVLKVERDYYGGMNLEMAIDGAVMNDTTEAVATETAKSENNVRADYSETNIQVQNVDEADIVKTDGDYIYYVANNKLYIVKASNLEIISEIKVQNEKERFYISEIYLKEDKLVLLGSGYILNEPIVYNEEEKTSFNSIVRSNGINTVKAIVYDIKDKNNPENIRAVELEGNYVDSRMIGDNLYFISRNYKYYYDGMDENTILPVLKDSTVGEVETVECTDIIYLKNSNDTSFMMVGGFDINKNEEFYVETLFGAGDIVYANENNLYLTRQNYGDDYKTTIYKFGLDGARIKLLAEAEVDGILNNQFSMDEYDGNLRIATTSYKIVTPAKEEYLDGGIVSYTLAERETTNNLYILNDKLEEVGKIENLAKDEKIYSVRFIGKMGYIVTFKEIDPLFVIDLSDPTNPVIKGELKIPGYSSYLHPYDETHLIGIGYNTKDNGYGGITNSTMKMSMFDVSDLENPVEMFNVDIGTNYANSDVTYNHKVLFYKKSENLIGFPVTYREENYRDDKNGFIIFKIDMENNTFEKHGEILTEIFYQTNVKRIIYIEDVLYTLSDTKIISYDLNTFEKINEIELTYEEDNYYFYNDLIAY